MKCQAVGWCLLRVALSVIGVVFLPARIDRIVRIQLYGAATEQQSYIGQEYVDTSIQRAFILLNAAADVAGVGFRQGSALATAKQIARELKNKARGDANERYVLWKVNELEAQIYLEEKDLILQQMQKVQITVNQLVDQFNAEVGKGRPDFAALHRIYKKMALVDVQKSNELADSFNKRYRGISREVVYAIEKALMAGDLDKSRSEVGYCLRNLLYLKISSGAYQELEKRVEDLYRARAMKPKIEQALGAARRSLSKQQVAAARDSLVVAENNLAGIKNSLPREEVAKLTSGVEGVRRSLFTVEDSLVTRNRSLLRTSGVTAANNYLQTVLKVCGVSREKVAMVDKEILSVASPEDTAMQGEIDRIVAATEGSASGALLDDIMVAAKRKAQVKHDSLQAIEDARMKKGLAAAAVRDSIARVEQEERLALLRTAQAKAESVAMELYSLLEKNNAKSAKKRYAAEQAFLQHYLRADAYEALNTTLRYFTEGAQPEGEAIAYIKLVDQPAGSSVAVADKAKSAQTNQGRAQKEIVAIYSLLEGSEIDQAYRRFQKIRTPLQKYLAPEAFSMLEVTVVEAYRYYAEGSQ